MTSEKIKKTLAAVKVTSDDPRFFQRVFTTISKQRKHTSMSEIQRICSEEYDDLSRRLDRSKIQESCAARNVLRVRRLVTQLINEKGELDMEAISEAITQLKVSLYSMGPDRQHDTRRQMHLLKVLICLSDSKDAQRILKNIRKPVNHRHADQIIRETLQLPAHLTITDAHARQAVLSAWMCYLRQNVGSCFATAPAIIIHDEQPIQFLNDMNELLSTGRLKRTFGGVEYAVPLSISWGAGNLKKNFQFDPSDAHETTEAWLSPGLIDALESIGILFKERPLKQRIEWLKDWMIKHFPPGKIIINSQTIFRHILLDHLNLTEKDLREFENRPQENMQTNLMLLSSTAPKTAGSKTQACMQYFAYLTTAENTFKSLADNALLKSWEFSLASFAETKAEFTRWNLYSSLGLGAQEKGGIGFCIYEILQQRLEISNQKVRELQAEYDTMYSQVKYLETRLQRASTEKELEWLKLDYKTKSYEFHLLEELRDKEYAKGQRIASLYDTLIDAYYHLFPEYFQEVYDADMHEVDVGPYDDSPAGFRLLYKYGRANTSQWTYIYTPQEFIAALNSFFIATEIELASRKEFEKLQQELSEIITAIVMHIKTKEFLESAFQRMAEAHHTRPIKDPLEHLDLIEKKPWAYTSGGTMGSLVSNYFALEQKPTQVARWVENPMELLVFLIDTVKQIPNKSMQDFLKEGRRGLLMHSPTHAFLLQPTERLFFEGWQSEAFTYTWVRDQWVKPRERFIDMIFLEEGMLHDLVQRLMIFVPDDFKHYFRKVFEKMHGTMSPVEFRNHIGDMQDYELGLQRRGYPVLSLDDIDSLLYALLPLFPYYKMGERLEELFKAIPLISEKERHELMDIYYALPVAPQGELYGNAKSLQDMAKAILCLSKDQTSSAVDWHVHIAQAARSCGFAMPDAIQFADTNWMKDDFAFVVSPGSGKLELWKVDPISATGSPMSFWRPWLDGSRKDLPWGVYTRPYEYIR